MDQQLCSLHKVNRFHCRKTREWVFLTQGDSTCPFIKNAIRLSCSFKINCNPCPVVNFRLIHDRNVSAPIRAREGQSRGSNHDNGCTHVRIWRQMKRRHVFGCKQKKKLLDTSNHGQTSRSQQHPIKQIRPVMYSFMLLSERKDQINEKFTKEYVRKMDRERVIHVDQTRGICLA